ncbi:MAG: hypothetical protein ACT4PZ_17615 [Panacagrimonas sp.]
MDKAHQNSWLKAERERKGTQQLVKSTPRIEPVLATLAATKALVRPAPSPNYSVHITLRPFGMLNRLFAAPWSLSLNHDTAFLSGPDGTPSIQYSLHDAALCFRLSGLLSEASGFDIFVSDKWQSFASPSKADRKSIQAFVDRGMIGLKLSPEFLNLLRKRAIRDLVIGTALIGGATVAFFETFLYESSTIIFWGASFVGVVMVFRSFIGFSRHRRLSNSG